MCRKLLLLAPAALLAAACNVPKPYTLSGETDPSKDGQTVYLYDLHEDRAVDSTVVSDGRFSFSGRIAGDAVRRVDLGRTRVVLILEGGDFTVDLEGREAGGSEKNEALNLFVEQDRWIGNDRLRKIILLHDSDPQLPEETIKAETEIFVSEAKAAICDAALPIVEANDNALGAYAFWRWCSYLDTSEEFEEALSHAGKRVRDFGPVKRIAAMYEAQKRTAEWMPFVDFTVRAGNADRTDAHLSDHVGRGRYTLVCFWNSWFDPCLEELSVVSRLWDYYGGEDFGVLGVTLWGEREECAWVVDEFGIEWPQIYDAGSEQAELYGIGSVPYTILFGPDGTILARGLRGEELEAKIAQLMAE